MKVTLPSLALRYLVRTPVTELPALTARGSTTVSA